MVVIPSLKVEAYECILTICNQSKVKAYKMPKVEDILLGINQSQNTMQKFNISDLLGRNEIEIVESGIRPGEKLYEELLISSELVDNKLNDKIFIGKVAMTPLSDIESFIQALKTCQHESRQLKETIITFANQSADY